MRERYGRSTIVFDQYTQRPSTKYQEHDRRKGKRSPNVHVTLSMTAQDFLTNEHNKNQFIVLVMEALESDGHCVKQPENDADMLIVSSASYSLPDLCPVVVVEDDTDVFVMMIYHCSSDMHNIYFFSEAAARSKKAMRYISVRGVQQKIRCDLARRIIFLHGWSGCDTTSAVFGQGKGAILKLIATSRPAQNIADMFVGKCHSRRHIYSWFEVVRFHVQWQFLRLFEQSAIYQIHKFSRKISTIIKTRGTSTDRKSCTLSLSQSIPTSDEMEKS